MPSTSQTIIKNIFIALQGMNRKQLSAREATNEYSHFIPLFILLIGIAIASVIKFKFILRKYNCSTREAVSSVRNADYFAKKSGYSVQNVGCWKKKTYYSPRKSNSSDGKPSLSVGKS